MSVIWRRLGAGRDLFFTDDFGDRRRAGKIHGDTVVLKWKRGNFNSGCFTIHPEVRDNLKRQGVRKIYVCDEDDAWALRCSTFDELLELGEERITYVEGGKRKMVRHYMPLARFETVDPEGIHIGSVSPLGKPKLDKDKPARSSKAVRQPEMAPYRPHTVTTREELAEVVEAYLEFDEFVFDVETKGPHRGDPRRNEVFWISLAGPGRADVIPMQHPLGDIVRLDRPLTKTGKVSMSKSAKLIPIYGSVPKQLWPGEVFAALEPLFFSKRRKVNHNVKFDLMSIAKYYDGRIPPPPYADTVVRAKLINENYVGYKPYGLGSCVDRAYGFKYDKAIGKEVEAYPFSVAANYSHLDAKWTWLLYLHQEGELEAEGLIDLYDFEMDVLEAVVAMENHGAPIDEAGISRLEKELTAEIDAVYARICKAAGYEINLNADAQVRELIYDKRKHKPRQWTEKTGQPSTAAKALEHYKSDPVVADILEWATLHKLLNTFVTGLIERLVDGRIHTNFNQAGAKTGRFSSDNINLQNIPVRDERGRKIRDMFVALPGYKLLVSDYSQIELRLLAHYCRDPLLLKAYTEGLDLHMLTAQRAYRTTEVSTRQRALAKNVNFSMVYGATAMTIVQRYEVAMADAEKMVDAFFKTYRQVDPWRKAVVKRCKRNRISKDRAAAEGLRPCPPYVETILGRKRRLPEIFYSDNKSRSYAERQAVNTVIQGSAADIMKLALVRAYKAFEGRDMHLILTVHDEVVAMVREDEVGEGVALLQEALEQVPVPLRVPLVAEVKVCERWSQKG